MPALSPCPGIGGSFFYLSKEKKQQYQTVVLAKGQALVLTESTKNTENNGKKESRIKNKGTVTQVMSATKQIQKD